MDKILQLIENIKNYGNCTIYKSSFNNEPNANVVIKLMVDQKGNLQIIPALYIFDEPFWNGFELNEKAIQRRFIDLRYGLKENLSIDRILAMVLADSLNKSSLLLDADKSTNIEQNTDGVVEKIYNIISKMLFVSENDLLVMVKNSKPSTWENIFLNQLIKDISVVSVPNNLKLAINLKVKNFEARFLTYKFIYEEIDTQDENSELNLNKNLSNLKNKFY